MTGWIFQGNPDFFMIDRYLRRKHIIKWTVRPEAWCFKMKLGDIAFLWRYNSHNIDDGGVIAVGCIMHTEFSVGADAPDLWVKPSEDFFPAKCAIIAIDEYRLTPNDGMLLRSTLTKHPLLKDLNIIKMFQGTAFDLTEDEVNELLRLWNGNKPKE